MKRKAKGLLLIAILFTVCCVFGFKAEANASTYKVKINKQQCVVTIYKKNKKGAFKAIKAMLCSPGNATPVGTFPLKEKMRWHTLMGPCYGQYCSRITGGVLFHSVWYYQPNPTTLAYRQYNLLGYRVSHGCVRLCVQDAKWIYDHIPSGTPVTVYNSKNPGPLGKPHWIKLSGYTGWDPTDPNPRNPYKKKKPSIRGAKSKSIAFAKKDNLKKGIIVKNTLGNDIKRRLKISILYSNRSGTKYAKVKKINTKNPGVYKITYHVVDQIGRKASVTVTHKVLTKVAVKKIKLNVSSKILTLGDTLSQRTCKLKAISIIPKKASIKKLRIVSTNKKIATVSSDGKVVAKKAGNCNIRFYATDGTGVYASCKIIVIQKPVIAITGSAVSR